MDEAIEIINNRMAELLPFALKTSDSYLKYMELENIKKLLLKRSKAK